MKFKLFFFVLILSILPTYLLAQDNYFSKLHNDKNISTIIISKTLLSLSGNVDVGGVNVKNISDKIDRVELFNSDNKKAIKQMKKELSNVTKDNTYEIIMKIKDNNNDISIIGKKDTEGIFRDVVFPVEAGSKYSIVRMLGAFTTEDIQSLVNESK